MTTSSTGTHSSGTSAMRKPDTSPTFAIVIGYAIVAAGVLVSLIGGPFEMLGILAAALGGLIATIGTVAAGVALGNRWTDYERSRRS